MLRPARQEGGVGTGKGRAGNGAEQERSEAVSRIRHIGLVGAAHTETPGGVHVHQFVVPRAYQFVTDFNGVTVPDFGEVVLKREIFPDLIRSARRAQGRQSEVREAIWRDVRDAQFLTPVLVITRRLRTEMLSVIADSEFIEHRGTEGERV